MAELDALVGRWDFTVDLAGAEHLRGHTSFEALGPILVQSTKAPVPDAPDTCCLIVSTGAGQFQQHYFDSRGVARIYEMTFDGHIWTLQRSAADFSPLDFHQRYIGHLSNDRATIDGEWHTSVDGQSWSRDFGLTYNRLD